MKKMALIITILSVVLVGLAALSLGCRHSRAHSGHHDKSFVMEKVSRELELDEQQQTHQSRKTRTHERHH